MMSLFILYLFGYMKLRRVWLVLIISIAELLSLTGCGTFGTEYLAQNHQAFNSASNDAINAQMLLNIVRLRYSEPPYFLKLNNITSQLVETAGGNITYSGTSGSATTAATLFRSINASFSHQERPTFSYQPMEDDLYTRKILRPMRFNDIYRFIASGWSVSRIFKISIQRLGKLQNGEGTNQPAGPNAPKNFSAFQTAMRELQRLEDKMLLSHRLVKADKSYYIEFTLSQGVSSNVARTLDIPVGTKTFLVGHKLIENSTIPIVLARTRSYLGIIYFLSKGVDIPECHYINHIARETFDEKHQRFDWQKTTKGLFHVRTSQKAPRSYFTRVYYKDSWYYIPQSYDNSKQTFSILLSLYALFGSHQTANDPVYTIPL